MAAVILFHHPATLAAPVFPGISGLPSSIGFRFNHFPFVLNGPGCLDLSPLARITTAISIKSVCIRQKDDAVVGLSENFHIEINNYSTKTIYDFVSSYPYLMLSVSVMTPGATNFVLLVHPEGGGTSATAVYLEIYAVTRDRVEEVGHYEIANYFGEGKMWWYTLQKREVEGSEPIIDYNAIEFVLGHDPINKKRDDPEFIPNKARFCVILLQNAQLEEREGPCPRSLVK